MLSQVTHGSAWLCPYVGLGAAILIGIALVYIVVTTKEN